MNARELASAEQQQHQPKPRHLLINVYQSTEEPLTTKELSELSEFTETFTNDVETILSAMPTEKISALRSQSRS